MRFDTIRKTVANLAQDIIKGIRYAGILWRPATSNKKLGRVLVSFVGETREESLASCLDCPLSLAMKGKDGAASFTCNQQHGTAGFAHRGMAKRFQDKPGEYTVAHAIQESPRGVNRARGASIGDYAATDPTKAIADIKALKSAGIHFWTYTHHWRRSMAAWLMPWAAASVHGLDQALEAFHGGWTRAATILDPNREEGEELRELRTGLKGIATPVLCPADLTAGSPKGITCETCKGPSGAPWCSPQSLSKNILIIFIEKRAAAGKRRRKPKQ